jgi:hypothetical protein
MSKIVKTVTVKCNFGRPHHSLSGSLGDHEGHPAFLAALEGLTAYNDWVADVVLPIAFQWIQENYTKVYEHIAESEKDDVGVVISAAFRLVKEMELYKQGQQHAADYEQQEKDKTLRIESINPVWAPLSKAIRDTLASVRKV